MSINILHDILLPLWGNCVCKKYDASHRLSVTVSSHEKDTEGYRIKTFFESRTTFKKITGIFNFQNYDYYSRGRHECYNCKYPNLN
jgi:hypothetical protein